jgi:putative phage-type endonuclease
MMHFPKTRTEWLALRHGHVSSTESSALFGMSKYQTAYELAVTKKRDTPDDSEYGGRAEWGRALEEVIAKHVSEKHGIKVRAMNGYASNNGMGASFDYEIVGTLPMQDSPYVKLYNEHGPGVLEIKNVDWLIFKNEWTDDEAPAHIEIQVQHQLECCERSWALIAALVGGNRLHIITRLRDEAVGAAIAKKCQKFWTDLNAGKMPPVTLPEDAELIATMYRYAEPDKLLDVRGKDSEVVALCSEYAAAAERGKAAEAAKQSAKAKLLMLIGDAERVLADGWTVSAGVTAEAEVPAYTRKAFRNLRVTQKKEKASG